MKVITTNVLIAKHIKVPVITEVYDPISKRRDGTITSQGPIVISGRNLAMLDLRDIRLCLIPVIDYHQLIEIHCIYKYSQQQVIISLPILSPGEYLPTVKMMRKGKEESLYIFPVSWVVLPESHYAMERLCPRYAKIEY